MASAAVATGRDRTPHVLVARIALLAALYVATGRLGLELAHYQDNATLVWPPTGLSLAALILYGIRLWPGVFVGALILNATMGAEWRESVGMAAGNTLEAVIGSVVLLRFVDFRPTLERVRDVVAFVGIGAFGCTLVSATIGVLALVQTGAIGDADPARVWTIWWLGDIGGAIVFAPLLFMIAHGSPPWGTLIRTREAWMLCGALATACLLAFGGALPAAWDRAALFLPFPFIVWAGTRLGPRGAVTISFGVLLIAAAATARGRGPFVLGDVHESMMFLWAYGVVIGTTALTLAAAIGQRDLAEHRYQAGETERLRTHRDRQILLERERIMREMHDGIGGQLVSTLAMLERGRATDEEVAEGLRRALDDMRIMVDSLDPYATDFRTSMGKLRARLEPVLRRNGMRLSWNVDDIPALHDLPAEKSLHLLRIVQEAVTNAIRHAQAGQIEVSVSALKGVDHPFSVEIRDDGRGFGIASRHEGRGIRNMRSRARTLSGTFSIEAGDPGTRVRLVAPAGG